MKSTKEELAKAIYEEVKWQGKKNDWDLLFRRCRLFLLIVILMIVIQVYIILNS